MTGKDGPLAGQRIGPGWETMHGPRKPSKERKLHWTSAFPITSPLPFPSAHRRASIRIDAEFGIMGEESLEERFKKAVWLIRNGPKMDSTNEQKLTFYSYFKQVGRQGRSCPLFTLLETTLHVEAIGIHSNLSDRYQSSGICLAENSASLSLDQRIQGWPTPEHRSCSPISMLPNFIIKSEMPKFAEDASH